jgi:protein phosphatase
VDQSDEQTADVTTQDEQRVDANPEAGAKAADAATTDQGENTSETAGDAPSAGAADGEPDAGASANGTTQEPEATSKGTPDEHAPLTPGTRLDFLVIDRLVKDTADERVYLVYEAGREKLLEDRMLIHEGEEGAFNGVAEMMSSSLRHPRLLAPRLILSREGHDYLVLDALTGPNGDLLPTAQKSGTRLDVVDALRAGIGIGDALNYLHRNDVAHLHVAPDTLIVVNGRTYLTGVEQGSYLARKDDPTPLYAQDANSLARALGALAGIAGDEGEDTEDMARENLRRIVAYGEADGFTSPTEVVTACGVAIESAARALPIPPAENTTERIALTYATATTVGMVRSQNQDACAAMIFDVYDDQAAGEPLAVFLVADGMGGEAHGEVASRIAARTVPIELMSALALPRLSRALRPEVGVPTVGQDSPADKERAETDAGKPAEDAVDAQETANEELSLAHALVRASEAANARIRALVAEIGRASGTTLTALAMHGTQAALAHVGDSRAYLLRNKVLVALTDDHSVLARLQMLDHPLLSDPDVFIPRSMLYRSLGQEDEMLPDLLELRLAAGDRLVLCSDGLWDEVDAEATGTILGEASDPASCAQALVRAANTAGGHDNSTAVAVFVHAVPEDEAASMPRPDDDEDANAWMPEPSEPGK